MDNMTDCPTCSAVGPGRTQVLNCVLWACGTGRNLAHFHLYCHVCAAVFTVLGHSYSEELYSHTKISLDNIKVSC
jgi:hypothetical protein